MAYVSLVRFTFGLLFLVVVALGCSTADGLDTGGGGDTSGPPDDDEQDPDANGAACGPEVFGWETACDYVGVITYENPLAPGEYLELAPFEDTFNNSVACCEGAPSTETADSACVNACIVEMCRIAGNIYRQLANENDWHCTQGCDFDTDACLAGVPLQQFPHPPFGDDFPHDVTVSCEATNVQPRHPDGVFAFINSPENYASDDPEPCNVPESEAEIEPLVSLVANTVVEDAGSYALASWWTRTSEGQQSSSNLAITVDYELYPCGSAECVELTRFDASIPSGSYAGLEVEAGKLSLVAVTARPVVDASGRFDFPAGSLHFVLAADIAGARLSITRTNATITHGRVSHATDLFELTDLDLRYTDSDFGAELRVELAGSHTNRTPRAAIRRLDLPFDCDDPVVFEAASVDPDGDPMQHYWWTPGGMVDASSTEVVLSPGDHRIILLSMDGRGAHDVTSLAFTRRCT
jgi:hypothetical protein